MLSSEARQHREWAIPTSQEGIPSETASSFRSWRRYEPPTFILTERILPIRTGEAEIHGCATQCCRISFQGHFDGVIKWYREMHVSSWPSEPPEVLRALDRLKTVHPDEPTQTHILHLSSEGEILGHVDNVEASGSWILGVSLGSTRVMRLESVVDKDDTFDILLPSGSVYLQRDSTRYNYKHSILKEATFRGSSIPNGQRLSIMLRNRLS